MDEPMKSKRAFCVALWNTEINEEEESEKKERAEFEDGNDIDEIQFDALQNFHRSTQLE